MQEQDHLSRDGELNHDGPGSGKQDRKSADIRVLKLVGYILGPYTRNQKMFDEKAFQLLRRIKNSIKFMRAKKVTSEVGCKLTSASEISLDESQSTASQSPQPATTMSNEDPKSDYMMGKMLPAGRSSPSSPRQAPLQQFCTPPPSETESFGDPKSPIRCESPRQTSGDEDSKFDDKTMHKMLPQGEALIAHGQDSLPKQSCASLSSSESSDESESIKNLLPRQATDNPSDLLSRSRHTLARQDSLQQQSCASPENSDLIKKEATHNPSNLLSRSRYALASLSRPLVYDHEEQMPLSKVENDTNHAIDYSVNCNNQYSCLMQNDKLMMVQNSRGKTDMLKVYSLLDDKAGVQEINLTNKAFYAGTPCIMFYFCNKLALLTGKVHNKILQLSMYQLDTKDAEATCASWKQVPLSRYSISDSLFNLENCIPVSHREDGVIIVSILNDRDNGNHRIVFHVFSQKPSGRKWTATSSLLPIQFSGNVEYQIQSCQIDLESKYIYCSILLHGAGAYIYKFDLMSLKQHQKISNSVSIKPVDNWRITEPALQNCFLSLLQEEIIMISFGNTDDKSIMKVKRPINFLPASPADYQFELPSEIKIVAASIVSASKIVVMYQNNQTKQRFIKTITI